MTEGKHANLKDYLIMEKFIIKGGKPLQGTINVSGYKNAAGAILAATLLTEEEVTVDNLPIVEDVLNLIKALESIGCEITWLGKRKIKIKAGKKVDPRKMDFDLISKMRVAVLLMGPLLSRFKNFKIPHPGGDKIGLRPIDTHLLAFEKLGAKIKEEGDFYYFKAKKLSGTEIILKEFSVTATENIMMAASLIPEKTIIKGAAAEPQVQDLGKMLKNMGVKIKGLDSHTIVIEGRKKLKGVSHKIIPDPIETATFIIASAITPGKVTIKNIQPDHLDLFLDKLKEIGINFQKNSNSIVVSYSPNLKPAKIQALIYPGFPTDFLPFVAVLLTQAKGKSLIHDPLYESRQSYLQELRKMGADIEIVDPHRAIIFGKKPLRGLTIESWDIRGGASLIISALMAKGETIIKNIYQIDRGYEKIEERLQKLGADIKRVK
jgi:UDP-N-acetylglucosamine 1-carboxyvinyltransferase